MQPPKKVRFTHRGWIIRTGPKYGVYTVKEGERARGPFLNIQAAKSDIDKIENGKLVKAS